MSEQASPARTDAAIGMCVMDNVQMPGVGLALSGGGFRATLFHLGSLWRLNELGWLPQISRISSVSGGSIVAGLLAARWQSLAFDAQGVAGNFSQQVAAPIQQFCAQNLDVRATLLGAFGAVPLLPAGSHYIAAALTALYDHLPLAMLPAPEHAPEFLFDATNLQTGSCFRFTREGLEDYKLGTYPAGEITLAEAIAASCAYPPFFAPMILKTAPERWRPGRNSVRHTVPALRQSISWATAASTTTWGWRRYGTITALSWSAMPGRLLICRCSLPGSCSARCCGRWTSPVSRRAPCASGG